MIEFDKIIDFLSLNELKSNYKKLNNDFTEKLKKDNISYSQFVHSCIYKYLNGELKLK